MHFTWCESNTRMQLVIHYTDPSPPTGVSAVTGTECNTADVSWSPSTVNYNAVIGNYSVRYRLRGSSGSYTTVYSPTTSITLRGLDPSAEYEVEVAAVDLCGRMSGFSEVASLDLQGMYNLTKFNWLYIHTRIYTYIYIIIILYLSAHVQRTNKH